MSESTDQESAGVNVEADDATKPSVAKSGGWKIRLGVLCAMLILALVGMGMTQASEAGAWEYWLFIVFVYAALGLWRNFRSAKREHRPLARSIGRELVHWGTLIVFLAVLLLLERREIVNRDSASYFALMLLALTCCLAGVHLDWLLLVVGIVLTIMLVATATLEQYSAVLWIFMVAVVCLAAAFFYIQSKRGVSESET